MKYSIVREVKNNEITKKEYEFQCIARFAFYYNDYAMLREQLKEKIIAESRLNDFDKLDEKTKGFRINVIYEK